MPAQEGVLIDRRFVYTAIFIGGAYTLIVLLVSKLASKDSAGIAGAVLTGMTATIFSKFERLQFVKQAKRTPQIVVPIPKFSSWYFMAIVFMFYGLQTFSGFLHATILTLIHPDLPEDLIAEAVRRFTQEPTLVLSIALVTTVIHFLGGFIVGRTARSVTYSYAVLSSFLSNILAFVLAIPFIIEDPAKARDLIQNNAFLWIFWLLYAAAALFGAKSGFRKKV